MLKIVVIGGGMSAGRFLECMAEKNLCQKFNITLISEEHALPYDRVHLSALFEGQSVKDLYLNPDLYKNHCIQVEYEKVVEIARKEKVVKTESGKSYPYDRLVIATGSKPFILPIDGSKLDGVFVYRTSDDVKKMISHIETRDPKRCVVLGGGLLGLECAGSLLLSLKEKGISITVVELQPRVMPLELNEEASGILLKKLRSVGMDIRLGVSCTSIKEDPAKPGFVGRLEFGEGAPLEAEMVIMACGTRPCDQIGRGCGLDIAARGGIVVNNDLCTSDPSISAIGEAAFAAGQTHGLLAPCNEMAERLANHFLGEKQSPLIFPLKNKYVKLKMAGVDVASFGDSFGVTDKDHQAIVFADEPAGVYRRLVVSQDRTKLLGGVLIGAADDATSLNQMCRNDMKLPEALAALVLPQYVIGDKATSGKLQLDIEDLPLSAQICACKNVTKGNVIESIEKHGLTTVQEIKIRTKAGTGCGGCLPLVEQILDQHMKKLGKVQKKVICPHFDYTRVELLDIMKIRGYKSFGEIYNGVGTVKDNSDTPGCEKCKPIVASLLQVVHESPLADHQEIQEGNDRFLGNFQAGGTLSVIPRQAGGELTADQLALFSDLAKEYGLFPKITSQRIGLFGAKLGDLPAIWKRLVDAGLESGTAFGKALRNFKACIGQPWCRVAVGDSCGIAARLENRYKGLRAPHKFKAAASACVNDCGEAKAKDVGLIATPTGWSVYVGGNAGVQPRHGSLLAFDIPEEEAMKLIDRFLMFYIRTANHGDRTARWLEKLDGGMEYLKKVIVDDSLGICKDLEREMQFHVEHYVDDWAAALANEEFIAKCKEYANSDTHDTLQDKNERYGHLQPALYPKGFAASLPATQCKDKLVDCKTDIPDSEFVKVGLVSDILDNQGRRFEVNGHTVAIFKVKANDGQVRYHATQGKCPHKGDNVLAHGIIGSQNGHDKISCPQHKNTYDLVTGAGLSNKFAIRVVPLQVRGSELWVAPVVCKSAGMCDPERTITLDW